MTTLNFPDWCPKVDKSIKNILEGEQTIQVSGAKAHNLSSDSPIFTQGVLDDVVIILFAADRVLLDRFRSPSEVEAGLGRTNVISHMEAVASSQRVYHCVDAVVIGGDLAILSRAEELLQANSVRIHGYFCDKMDTDLTTKFEQEWSFVKQAQTLEQRSKDFFNTYGRKTVVAVPNRIIGKRQVLIYSTAIDIGSQELKIPIEEGELSGDYSHAGWGGASFIPIRNIYDRIFSLFSLPSHYGQGNLRTGFIHYLTDVLDGAVTADEELLRQGVYIACQLPRDTNDDLYASALLCEVRLRHSVDGLSDMYCSAGLHTTIRFYVASGHYDHALELCDELEGLGENGKTLADIRRKAIGEKMKE